MNWLWNEKSLSERLTWLRERQGGMGGTDVVAACGIGFSDPAQLYSEKVAPEPIDREPSGLMLLGLATEDLNAALYARRTGAKLVSPGMIRAKDHPWAFATYDRVRCDGDHADPATFGCPVELKYAGPHFGDQWGEDGTDEVRDGYTIQATWEALVLRLNGSDVRRTDLSALSGTGEHRVYPVRFDEHLGHLLFETARAFWKRVEDRRGVEDWNPPLANELADRLAAIKPDRTVRLDLQAAALVDQIDALSLVKKEGEAAEDRIRALKRELSLLLGEAQVGLLPDGRRVKQNLIPAKLITPEPYERQARVDVRILKPLKKGKASDE